MLKPIPVYCMLLLLCSMFLLKYFILFLVVLRISQTLEQLLVQQIDTRHNIVTCVVGSVRLSELILREYSVVLGSPQYF